KPVIHVHCLGRQHKSVRPILQLAGTLFARGHEILISEVSKPFTSGERVKTPRMCISRPPYVFNHSQTFRAESTISKNLRQCKWPRHDLLGAPVPDWDAEQSRWRNWIRISETPWLADHKVIESSLE